MPSQWILQPILKYVGHMQIEQVLFSNLLNIMNGTQWVEILFEIFFLLFYFNLSFFLYAPTLQKKVREIPYLLIVEIRMRLQNWLQPILNVQIPDMTRDNTNKSQVFPRVFFKVRSNEISFYWWFRSLKNML